jgi:hypothetical protein
MKSRNSILHTARSLSHNGIQLRTKLKFWTRKTPLTFAWFYVTLSEPCWRQEMCDERDQGPFITPFSRDSHGVRSLKFNFRQPLQLSYSSHGRSYISANYFRKHIIPDNVGFVFCELMNIRVRAMVMLEGNYRFSERSRAFSFIK